MDWHGRLGRGTEHGSRESHTERGMQSSHECQTAPHAFKDSMIHGDAHVTLPIAFRCVLHRCENQDIPCAHLLFLPRHEHRHASTPVDIHGKTGIHGMAQSYTEHQWHCMDARLADWVMACLLAWVHACIWVVVRASAGWHRCMASAPSRLVRARAALGWHRAHTGMHACLLAYLARHTCMASKQPGQAKQPCIVHVHAAQCQQQGQGGLDKQQALQQHRLCFPPHAPRSLIQSSRVQHDHSPTPVECSSSVGSLSSLTPSHSRHHHRHHHHLPMV
jgi:hypothetical protein